MTLDTNRSSTIPFGGRHNLCMPSGKKTAEAVLAGERIKAIYTKLGIDRGELAKRAKIGYSTLGNYEQGLRELPIRAARQLEKATRIPAAYLMGLVDEQDMELLQAPREARIALLQALKSASHAYGERPSKPPAEDPFQTESPVRPGRRVVG